MMKFTLAVLIGALGLALVVTNADSAEQMPSGMGRAFATNDILGVHVMSPQGEILGRISDLIVDSQGRVDLIVLSHGGFLRIGEKETAVPFSALRYDQTHKSLTLDISKDELAGAPTFKMTDLSDQKRAEDIYRYFGQQSYWSEGEDRFKGIDEPLEAMSIERQPFSDNAP